MRQLVRTLAHILPKSSRVFGTPIPVYEWNVVPPTLMAAMPVGATVTTCLRAVSTRYRLISRRRVDLPVPATPVRGCAWEGGCPPRSQKGRAARARTSDEHVAPAPDHLERRLLLVVKVRAPVKDPFIENQPVCFGYFQLELRTEGRHEWSIVGEVGQATHHSTRLTCFALFSSPSRLKAASQIRSPIAITRQDRATVATRTMSRVSDRKRRTVRIDRMPEMVCRAGFPSPSVCPSSSRMRTRSLLYRGSLRLRGTAVPVTGAALELDRVELVLVHAGAVATELEAEGEGPALS